MKIANKSNIPTMMQQRYNMMATHKQKQNNNDNDNSQTHTLSPLTDVLDMSVPHPSTFSVLVL
jgi:hypothetical protein